LFAFQVLPAGGKVLMAEDLEASLFSPASELSKSSGNEAAFMNHHYQHHQNHGAAMPSSAILRHGPVHGNKPPGPAPALPAGARVTTLEELEAGLRDVHVVPASDLIPECNSQQDLSAFQKLLGLVNRDEVAAEVSDLRGEPVPGCLACALCYCS
jgi:hypothetical protein